MVNNKSVSFLVLGLITVLSIVISSQVFADKIALRPDHPERYVVQEGDTLWDISARFLETPWRWPEVWEYNPDIKNPHLIYPGDVVSLVYDAEGNVRIQIDPNIPTRKISPKVHKVERTDRPINTVPMNSIQQFLSEPRVVTEDELDSAAYIVSGAERRIIAGKNDIIYVRGIITGGDREYNILRMGEPYVDPDSDDVLGYEALHVADATVKEFGDPSTLLITGSNREALLGDRLLPKRANPLDTTYIPHAPDAEVDGKIIAVVDGVSVIGQYQTVVINRGEQDGIETGHVLAVYQKGAIVRDVNDDFDKVRLPEVKAGIIMVIRTFDRMSYALVMEAEKEMRIYDKIRKP
ncbi:MAG: LysM peptidoglycan-binding domain-containing protein [Gammaproteobacteria bacterium]|nr:LysM peptidoglycan-binding domain-containing protein [Gammaproteobacteria bacterium]MDH5802021.1 LysM peptidoglycan-binding domain-containing protein [Gammaproteobacteria bacterium]